MNLGNIGSLVISLSATGADKTEKDINAVTKSLEKSGKKMKEMGQQSLFTIGNIAKAVSALGIAGILMQSPLINSYLSEFMMLLGSLGDTIAEVFGPFIEIALEGLWKLADWFASQAPLLAVALAPLLPMWQTFINLITTTVGPGVLMLLVDLITRVITFISELFTAIGNKDWGKAWNTIATALGNVWSWIKTYLIIPGLGWIFHMIVNFDWLKAWDSFYSALGKIWEDKVKPKLPTWLTKFMDWMKEFFEGDGKTNCN